MTPMPTSVQIGVWIITFFFLVAGWNQVEKFMDRRKEKPSTKDLQLDATDRFATKADLRDHTQADDAAHNQLAAQLKEHIHTDDGIHSELFAKVGTVERGVEERLTARLDKLEVSSLESRRNMHRDIDALSKDVAGVKATVALNSDQLKDLGKQQAEIPSQIVALLKNTGAIK